MKANKNNKGFSLVELIIAFAIFAIVGVAVCGFIVFSNKNFAAANKNLKLQYEQQVVVNRIRDIVIETSRGVNYNPTTNTLIVLSDNAGSDKDVKPYAVARLRYDSANKKLLLTEENIAKVDSIKDIAFSASEGVLCDTIATADAKKKPFDVHLDDIDSGKITLDIIFMVGEKEVEVHPVINLRNMIKNVGEEDELGEIYTELIPEFYSKVASVVITRDGMMFSQGRTDTIAMAGDTTSVDYDAIVKKKSAVKESINTDVSWEIDLQTIKDKYKYEADGVTPSAKYKNCIVVDAASGLVTVKNVKLIDENKEEITLTPNDVINGDYFIIKAISNEDPTKIARLRIKVTTGGVYPVSIKTTLSADSPILDLVNSQAVYKLTHSITYTAKIRNPITGQLVNPLDGDGAYTKLHYQVYSDAALTTKATLAAGTGFVNVDGVDGRFVVSKSMCDKTYYIANVVDQRDKDGQVVQDVLVLKIPKDLIGEKVDATVPSLNCLDEHLRADTNPASANWSKGTPTYYDENEKREKKYTYEYEWTIVPLDGGAFTRWGNTRKNKFNGDNMSNIYFTQGNRNSTTITRSSLQRITLISCEPSLDWQGTFRYRIELRVKLKGGGREGYYKLPDKDENDRLNYIGSNDDAYVVSKVVVINPVGLTLKPAPDTIKLTVNGQPVSGYYNSDSIVHMGKKEMYKEWGPVWDPNAWGPGLADNVWKEFTKFRGNPGDYYKIFIPEFTGIKVYDLNYNTIFDVYGEPVKRKFSDTSSTLVPYYLSGNAYDYNNKNALGYNTGATIINDKLYFYLKLTPSEWESDDKFPVGCKWTCLVADKTGNSVRGIFTSSNSDFINYTVHHAYEGECEICKK